MSLFHLRRYFLLSSLALFSSAFSVHAAPYIFNITKSALPGDVIGVQGDGFSPDSTVWVDRMEAGDTTPNPETLLTEVLTLSGSYIGIKLPATLASGVYAVFVKEGDSVSQAAWINRADGWHFLDLAGKEISPGFRFRIAGRNLFLAGSAPQVRFVDTVSGAILPATAVATAGEANILTCTAPAGLVVGQQYHVEVNNGFSTFSGSWTRVPSTTLLARAAGYDLFGIGVPWAADITATAALMVNVKAATFNAVGNGLVDDRMAVQRAIDFAWSKGGGIVYLPRGIYQIGVLSSAGVDYNLIMRPNVVLMGDGIGQTIIRSNGGASGLHAGVVYVMPGSKNIGFYSLTISGGASSLMAVNNFIPLRSFMIKCRVENGGGAGSRAIGWREGYESVFRDCQFSSSQMVSDAPYFSRQDDVLMKGCYFEYHDGRVDFVQGERVQLEACIFARSVATDGANQPEFGGLVAPLKDFALIGSSFVALGGTKLAQANDGEAILCEYPSNNLTFGIASSSGTASLTDSLVAWQTNALAGKEISIIKGPGLGQRRKVLTNNANSLIIAEPWAVQPVAGETYYSVSELCERHLIRGNVFSSSPRGIWYYRSALEDLVITSNYFVDTAYPVLLRGNQRLLPEIYSMGNEFNTLHNVLVEKNVGLVSASYPYAEPVSMLVDTVLTSGSELYGNFFYDCVIRDNTISGNNMADSSGIYLAHNWSPTIDNEHPSSVGIIVQRNTLQYFPYGVSVGTGNHQTILWGNNFLSVGSSIQDIQLPGHAVSSTDTVVGP